MSMGTEKWESRIIEYIDGKGTSEERALVEKELASNEAHYLLYEQFREVIHTMDKAETLQPSSKLTSAFETVLRQEIDNQKKTRSTVFFAPTMYRIAAGVIFVMVLLGVGYWVNKNNEYEKQLVELKNQLEENRRMMLARLGDQQSASQRMVGVSVAYELETPDDQIVEVLVKTMNEDTNSNVRLAALDALSKFNTEDNVRQALINSLATQKDPVVQIALIQLLVKLKEDGVVKQLEKLTKDASTMKAVKDEAYTGILKLS
ncbi:MAG: HEAT repeat domain-containing protein [Cyclobacteriaceae bacterium]|nr:HEAT repeat domain-containing protein [Cyclobacteriaceae bacterium]